MMIDESKTLLLARVSAAALLLLSVVGFSGCSSVPDEVNPVEWYRGASGWFESDKDQAQRDQANTAKETAPPLPGSDKPYPNLSTVPERPRSVSSPEERNKVQQGLAADRANARYAKPDQDRPSGDDMGAPVAVPRVPVTIGPSGPSPETLEALPPDIAPPPPPDPMPPRSSLDDTPPVATAAVEAPAPSAAAAEPPLAEAPVIQPASYSAPADDGRATAVAALAAANVSDAPPSPAPRSAAPSPAPPPAAASSAPQPAVTEVAAAEAQGATQADRASDTMVAQQANLPPTGAGQDLPRSFMVYFPGGSATLDGVDKEMLRDVARLYQSHGGTLRIVGHASSATREKDAYKNQIVNLRVSTQRAEAVARELARLGVPRDKMTVAGVSDSEPLYAETTQAGIAGNRRVEIFFGP